MKNSATLGHEMLTSRTLYDIKFIWHFIHKIHKQITIRKALIPKNIGEYHTNVYARTKSHFAVFDNVPCAKHVSHKFSKLLQHLHDFENIYIFLLSNARAYIYLITNHRPSASPLICMFVINFIHITSCKG